MCFNGTEVVVEPLLIKDVIDESEISKALKNALDPESQRIFQLELIG
ncbi:MAG: hypothetical protein GX912_00220 [Gammaproteobacteria bacterium]|nr:hypothetical protein [Gammaproteobacteria bacterium]